MHWGRSLGCRLATAALLWGLGLTFAYAATQSPRYKTELVTAVVTPWYGTPAHERRMVCRLAVWHCLSGWQEEDLP